jgi:tRNA pseudouridine55 synthase
VVDKEAGWTSHDVVAKSRGLLRTKKVGHSGTLDPDATGVLVLGVGSATRLLRFLTVLPKQYSATIRFGSSTSTLDAAGDVLERWDMSDLKLERVRAASTAFVGAIEQIPPMVSAVKIDGTRLHELARQGKEVERPPRAVTVSSFDLEATDDPTLYRANVACSSGTYIRTLAADLGTALGGGAHIETLRRTAVGEFTLADARPLEQIELLPVEQAARGLGRIDVDEAQGARVAVGAVFGTDELGIEGSPPWPVFSDGRLLAYYEPYRDGQVKPAVVIKRD